MLLQVLQEMLAFAPTAPVTHTACDAFFNHFKEDIPYIYRKPFAELPQHEFEQMNSTYVRVMAAQIFLGMIPYSLNLDETAEAKFTHYTNLFRAQRAYQFARANLSVVNRIPFTPQKIQIELDEPISEAVRVERNFMRRLNYLSYKEGAPEPAIGIADAYRGYLGKSLQQAAKQPGPTPQTQTCVESTTIAKPDGLSPPLPKTHRITSDGTLQVRRMVLDVNDDTKWPHYVWYNASEAPPEEPQWTEKRHRAIRLGTAKQLPRIPPWFSVEPTRTCAVDT